MILGRCCRHRGLTHAVELVGILFLIGLLFAGCGSNKNLIISHLAFDPDVPGNNQCGIEGQVLSKPLRVAVYGNRPAGEWGSDEDREAEGAAVTFRVENPESGAVFDENGAATYTVESDSSGRAKALLRLGQRPGDVRVVASVETPEGTSSVRFRASAGVVRIGKDLEAPTEGKIDEFGVQLFDAADDPAEGVPVHFVLVGDTSDAKIGSDLVVTDAEGKAVTTWKLGKKSQRYFATVEIMDERPEVPADRRFSLQAIQFKAMALDKKTMLVNLLGGLAIFILGMKMMSANLQRMADRRLKMILQAATYNRFVATGVGAFVTSVIQSSSATTVMAVGFVNAGLITLVQAIGIIYGANIGTTITAQLIAFKLEELAYPAIALGLVMSSLSKRTQIKFLGEAILGFGLLFLGMMTMSSVLKPLRYSPEFQNVFMSFDCTPVNGQIPLGPAVMCIIIGTIATCVIQSSSASIGLVQALASQGLVSFYTAFPIVLGDNIGTTITAIFASIGGNRNAKRVALAHALFNIFGACYMYVLLFVPLWNGQPIYLGFIDFITPGNAFGEVPENLSRHIANAHSTFNILNCILFLPFVAPLAFVCRKIIPVTDADRESVLQYLEPNLLLSPSLAVQQAVKEVGYMVRRAWKSVDDSCEFFFDGESTLERVVNEREVLIDRLQQEITEYLVELSDKPLLPREAILIPALIHAVNDAERIGDHSESLLEAGLQRREGQYRFSPEAENDIRTLLSLVDRQFEATHKALRTEDTKAAATVLELEEEINAFTKKASEDHVKRLEQGTCNLQSGILFLEFISNLERVGDRLSNIAERAGQILGDPSIGA